MSLMIQITILISCVLILGTYLLNKSSYEYDKYTPIECGFEPIEEKPGIETREKYYIRFYIIGIIFLIFDLESILLFPLTTTILYNVGIESTAVITTLYIVFIIFMFILILGLAYEYRKGVLN